LKLGDWMVALLDTSLPSEKATAVNKVEEDLGQADTALEAISGAILTNNQGSVLPAHNQFIGAIDTANTDVAAL